MRSYLSSLCALGLVSLATWLVNLAFQPGATSSMTSMATFIIEPQEVERALAPSPSIIAESRTSRTWLIPFATGRQLPEADSEKRAWSGRFTAMQLGLCEVDVPFLRPDGDCATAPIDAQADDERWQTQIVRRATSISSEKDFFEQVREQVDRAPHRDVLVFIHGFNVSFHGAICRAAQLAEDLPFNGVTICYSWPSEGELTGYGKDGKRVQWDQLTLVAFLGKLRKSLDPDVRIHVLAHSMGNRILLSALTWLNQPAHSEKIDSSSGIVDPRIMCDECFAWSKSDTSNPPLENVIFAAPDVEVEQFKKTVSAVRRVMRHATLYASTFDLALVSSTKVNLGEKRAGDASYPVLLENLVTVDVSAVPHHDPLGHSYYGNSPQVRRDIFYRLRFNYPPQMTPWLHAKSTRGGRYWTFDGEPPTLMSLKSDTLRKNY